MQVMASPNAWKAFRTSLAKEQADHVITDAHPSVWGKLSRWVQRTSVVFAGAQK